MTPLHLPIPDPLRAFACAGSRTTPIHRITTTRLPGLISALSPAHQQWVRSSQFDARPGKTLLLPNADGTLGGVLVGIDEEQPLWQLAGLPALLPAGIYQLAQSDDALEPQGRALLHLGWALGALAPARPQASVGAEEDKVPRLLSGEHEMAASVSLAHAVSLVRGLVNLPANQLGPERLAGQVRSLAERHTARYSEWVGDDLLNAGFELVHAVGRAGTEAPRVAKLEWGAPSAPKLILIGKGVCFDSGGLDLKQPAGMRWMKKDMGGAAHAIALAELIMQAGLAVHLTLLVPAVENSIGAQALRPGDIIKAGNGRTVEIENTDAEGRLILADALIHGLQDGLSHAARPPALVMDLATLTGAARTALGPELPALFSNHDGWAAELLKHAGRVSDPLWRLPLWAPYRRLLKSDSADTLNASSNPMAGAITAALFLEDFVPAHVPWLHLDLYAWNQEERPGRPKGGEAQGLRALFSLLSEKFPAE